jgi:hypothetical protein
MLCATLLLSAASAIAQPQPARTPVASSSPWQPLQFGLYVGGMAGAPSASFTSLPGLSTCLGDTSGFDGGSGGGFAVAAMAGLRPRISGDFLSHVGAWLRVGFASTGTTFETTENIGPAIDRSGTVSDVIDSYTIKTTISELRLEPSVTYQVGVDVPLVVSLGAKLGLLMSSTYEQSEGVSSPAGATFADGSTQRNTNSGDLTETSGLLAGIDLGIGYDIWVGQTIVLRPEVSGMLALGSPVSGVTWSPHELRGGLSILYTPMAAHSTPLGD